MSAIRKFGPATVVVAYASFYAWSWWVVWQVHQTDEGDGLEYLWVFATTLPWSIVATSIASAMPENAFPAIMTAGAVINATLLWLIVRRLLAPRRNSEPL